MIKIISIPRINALGLKGPEKTSEILLKKINHEILFVKNENINFDEKIIQREIKKHLNENKKILAIGGDHSITYPIGKSFLKKYKEKSFLIVFDAHPDCMPAMREPTHEEFLSGLIRIGWNPKNICLIGIRKLEPEEKIYIKKNKIKYFPADANIKEIKQYLKTISKKIYLSIDIDVIDPKSIPAVNYPERNGFSEKQFISLLKYILKKKSIELIDIVEFVPNKDKNNKSKKFIIKLIKLIKNSL